MLTGIPAGKRRKSGQWEKDSINYLVQQRLTDLVAVISNKPTTSLDTEL